MSTWAIFALSLLIRLIYNLFQPSAALFTCDGFEYLTDAQAVLAFIQKGTNLQSLHDLSIAGPVFPLFILGSCLLFGQSPALDHAMPLLITQSLISALTCVFIAMIAEMCWNRRVGQIAGLIAALYPAFIIGSGRLYTETFAVFLLSGLILLVCRLISVGTSAKSTPEILEHTMSEQSSLYICTIAGLIATALQLTRSSMAMVLAVSILFVAGILFREKQPALAMKLIAAYATGFLLLVIPWLYFSYVAFGTASIILDRASHYNFFVGNNVDSWGWLPVPAPDLTGIDRASLLQIIRCATHKNLGLWFNLLLNKPARLFDFPWNDFHASIGPLDYHLQILLHQALLLPAAIGICLCLFSEHSSNAPLNYSRQLVSRLFLFVVLCWHLINVFFITVPRYNLMAMPVLIAFASAGLVQLFRLLSNRSIQKRAIYLIVAAIGIFITAHFSLQSFSQFTGLHSLSSATVLLLIVKAVTCITFFYLLWLIAINEFVDVARPEKQAATAMVIALALIVTTILVIPARGCGRFYEWQMTLPDPSHVLTTIIQLPTGLSVRSHACYLLLDSSSLQQIQHDAVVRVNGRQLTGPFIPGLSLMGNLSGFQALDLHQIYLECGYIFNSLSYPSNISNVDLRQWFFIPLPQDVVESALKRGYIQIDIASSGTTPLKVFAQHVIKNHVLMPSLDRCSWEKAFYSVENDHGFSDPRYDYKLSSTASNGSLIPDVLLIVSNTNPGVGTPITVPTTIKHSLGSLSICSGLVPSYNKSSFWIIRITGCANSAVAINACVESRLLPQQSVDLHMASAQWAKQGPAYESIKSTQTFTYIPPWTPRQITLEAHGASFDVAFPLIPSALPGTIQSVKLSIDSGGIPLELSGCKMEIYDLSACPLSYPLHVKAAEHLEVSP